VAARILKLSTGNCKLIANHSSNQKRGHHWI
jgi:hypothetical protein